MAYSGLELTLHRNSTDAFIAADPTTIVLHTRQTQLVAGTKKTIDGPDREPQTFKIIWAYDNGIVRYPDESRGGVRRFDFIILGSWNATVEIGDWWKVGDQVFEVEYIFPGNGYEVKAGGVSHGSSPT